MFSITVCSQESSISNKNCNELQYVFIREISSVINHTFLNVRKARYTLDAILHKSYKWLLRNLERTYLQESPKTNIVWDEISISSSLNQFPLNTLCFPMRFTFTCECSCQLQQTYENYCLFWIAVISQNYVFVTYITNKA